MPPDARAYAACIGGNCESSSTWDALGQTASARITVRSGRDVRRPPRDRLPGCQRPRTAAWRRKLHRSRPALRGGAWACLEPPAWGQRRTDRRSKCQSVGGEPCDGPAAACVFDLASRAYRRAKAALCGYSGPLKLSGWRPGNFARRRAFLGLDARPVAQQLHADLTAPEGALSATRHRCSPRANAAPGTVAADVDGDRQRDQPAGRHERHTRGQHECEREHHSSPRDCTILIVRHGDGIGRPSPSRQTTHTF